MRKVYNDDRFTATHDERSAMVNRIRVGIIGLGRLWQRRYRPALRRLADRFEIRAVCDQVQQQAILQAKGIGCQAAAGPTELLERHDVEALLLLDRQWFGLWPLGLACLLRKPVFSCSWLEHDDTHADELREYAEKSGIAIMMATALRFAPGMDRLRELFQTELGSPRTLLCHMTAPAHSLDYKSRTTSSAARQLLGPRGGALLDSCACLFGGEPSTVWSSALEQIGWSELFMEFRDSQSLHITRRREPGSRPHLHLKAVTERALLSWKPPNKLSWTDSIGKYSHELPPSPPLAEINLERFWQVVRGNAVPEPNFRDSYRALCWLRGAILSHTEHRPINLADSLSSGCSA